MSCGGGMMRTSFQPLAHLVDAAALKWLAADREPARVRNIVRDEIAGSFRIGDRDELTFHGLRYLLSVRRNAVDEISIDVHEIALNE
jgi:hypothetical protein